MSDRMCRREGCANSIPSLRGSRAVYCSHYCQHNRHSAGSGPDLSTLDAPDAAYVAPERRQARAPKAWEPGIEWDGHEGVIVSKPLTERPKTWDELLEVWDLDPAIYEVIEPVQYRAWDAAIGDGNVQRMFYYRATIRTRQPSDGEERAEDIEALTAEIMRRKAPSRLAASRADGGDRALVVQLSDWQVGKGDGDGVEGTVTRIIALEASVKARYRELRKIGRHLESLYVVGMGDLFERCAENYPQQTYTVQLNNRDQRRVTRRLLLRLLRAWAPDFPRTVVLAVPGNHGEWRRNGKSFTDDADNDDVAVFEDVYDVLKERPGFEGVSFVLPRDEMEIVLDVAGVPIAWTHAHKAEGGGASGMPQAKLKSWWQKQAFGERPAGDAKILVSAHYHHFSVIEHGPKVHMQCPAMDGGSKWFRDTAGVDSRAGALTFVAGGPSLYSDLEIL